ncbi:MAG: CCA tRNA nucleotidyltransferase [Lachnospiraceae bacterium]|nr:CCA tRNA nucleotidyltransferase [Lachnospiraceae bacterium]
MKIKIPQHANYIIKTLQHYGYEAYIVGGCVRDAVLNKEPADWDITTSAKPLQIKSIFQKTVDTGLKHGTVTVLMEKEPFEVTTYRIDGEYEDHRRPNEVRFTTSLEEDLKRRDFTINAMAYNDTDGLVDLFGGMDDLNRKRIRCVGHPDDRFDEDALRMLRAIRFAAQLGFEIEEPTMDAIRRKYMFLKDISAERVQVELTKLLVSEHPEKLKIAYELGMTGIFLPEFDAMMDTPQHNPHHKYNVGDHTIEAVKRIPADKVLRLAALLHDVGKPDTRTTDPEGIDHFYDHYKVSSEKSEEILRRLKYDNHTIKAVYHLIEWHDFRWDDESYAGMAKVRRMISKVGLEYFGPLLTLQRADILGQSSYLQEQKLTVLDQVEAIYQEVKKNHDCLTVKDLNIDGVTLMRNGIPAGKRMGIILEKLLDMVIEEPKLNQRAVLLELAKKINEVIIYS